MDIGLLEFEKYSSAVWITVVGYIFLIVFSRYIAYRKISFLYSLISTVFGSVAGLAVHRANQRIFDDTLMFLVFLATAGACYLILIYEHRVNN